MSKIKAFYGSKNKISEWDIKYPSEFGYHFGLDDMQSINRLHGHGILYEVSIDFQNPVTMIDPGRWTLENILDQLGMISTYQDLKQNAIRHARKNFSSLRVEENLIASQVLDKLGFDAITYKNRGEGGGDAVIIWRQEQIKVNSVKNIDMSECLIREIIRNVIIENQSLHTSTL